MRDIQIRRPENRRGFTILELMVVLVILSLLGALVAPRFFGQVKKAKHKAASAQISYLELALDSFFLDAGRYPTTAEGLDALITRPSGVPEWNGPYLKKSEIPLDPWGNAYIYMSPGSHGDYDLYSYGADGTEGGEGENADIVSWKSSG
jgi:general secretion pathway protein G